MVQNNSANPIIACTLTKAELTTRKLEFREKLLTQLEQSNEIANGYQFIFLNQGEIKEDIVAFIAAEQQCCSFLNFELSTNTHQLILDMTGPEGTKEFIAKVML